MRTKARDKCLLSFVSISRKHFKQNSRFIFCHKNIPKCDGPQDRYITTPLQTALKKGLICVCLYKFAIRDRWRSWAALQRSAGSSCLSCLYIPTVNVLRAHAYPSNPHGSSLGFGSLSDSYGHKNPTITCHIHWHEEISCFTYRNPSEVEPAHRVITQEGSQGKHPRAVDAITASLITTFSSCNLISTKKHIRVGRLVHLFV